MTDEAEQPARRRLDRITAEDYLDDVATLDLEAVRGRRDECAAEESQLSYLRRMLQARLDIVRAERQRRREGGTAHSLVDALPALLADAPPENPQAARAMSTDPPEHQMRRREDRLAVDGTLARLPDLSDQELEDVAEQLGQEESRVSRIRSTVQTRLDELQDALVARYRQGEGEFAGRAAESSGRAAPSREPGEGEGG